MKAILWGKASQEYLAASAEGLKACGYETKLLRPHVRNVEECLEPCDLVIVAGTRLQSAEVRDLYQARGVPVIVVDAPPIRLEGFYAVTPWRVNNIPATAATSRLHFLEGIKPVRKPGWKVLVCGQTADDAAHLLGLAELREFYLDTLLALGHRWSFEQIVWRSHPHNPMEFEGFGVSEHETIDEALEDGIAAVVTFNSTCGLRALIRRVPTYCHPFAFYSEVAEVGLPSPFNLRLPSVDRLNSYLARVMSAQWSFEELATAEPWRRTLGRMGVYVDAVESVAV